MRGKNLSNNNSKSIAIICCMINKTKIFETKIFATRKCLIML